MKIAYDQKIPYVYEYFSKLGDMLPIDQESINKADLLVIRSNIQINEELIRASKLKGICTVSAGTDHIDMDLMRHKNIAVFHAKGANAIAVSDYVMAAFFSMEIKKSPLSVGIIGLGNIGKNVYKRFQALGHYCISYDPFILNSRNDFNLGCFEEILNCDVISLHVPLTKIGEYPTYHMINFDHIMQLKENALLINTSRGGVISEEALQMRFKSQKPLNLVLDVWENEPKIDKTLLKYSKISTPHIAGWSDTGRRNAVLKLCNQVASFFHISLCPEVYSSPQRKKKNNDIHAIEMLSQILDECVNIKSLSSYFKLCLENSFDIGKAFLDFQKNYISRPELSDYAITIGKDSYKIYEAFEINLAELEKI